MSSAFFIICNWQGCPNLRYIRCLAAPETCDKWPSQISNLRVSFPEACDNCRLVAHYPCKLKTHTWDSASRINMTNKILFDELVPEDCPMSQIHNVSVLQCIELKLSPLEFGNCFLCLTLNNWTFPELRQRGEIPQPNFNLETGSTKTLV